MATTRCKMKVTFKGASLYGGGDTQVNLAPVWDPNPESENFQFWKATPQGSVALIISNPDGAAVFEPNKEYYVDFSPTGED